MLRAVYTCILILIERTCKEMLRGVYTCILIFIECTCKRCCVVFIHVFFIECTGKGCCVENVVFVLFNGPISIEALVETWHAYWTDMKNMFYKKQRFVLLIGPVYHRCARNRHAKSDRPQKEGAWLNQTYWPITYNKIWYIKKNTLLQKTCDMCSLARHQKPKNVCNRNSFGQIQIVLKSCDSQELEIIGTRVPSFRNLVRKRSNQCFPILEAHVPSSRN